MRMTGPKSLKYTLLAFSVLLFPSCASVDSAIDDTTLGMDIMSESFGDATDTASRIPMSSEDYLKGTCPPVKLVNELGELYDFTDFKRPNENNLITRVRVGKLSSTCNYTDRSVTVDMNLVFEGLLGPGARIRAQDAQFHSYPFFVAITSPSNVILARQIFSAPMEYAPGQTTQVYRENIRQIIPIPKEQDGKFYNILIGFQLNKQQLEYNRDIAKTRKKIAQKESKARKAAEKNAPPVMPLREDVIRQQSGYYAPPPQVAPTAPVMPVTPAPLPNR